MVSHHSSPHNFFCAVCIFVFHLNFEFFHFFIFFFLKTYIILQSICLYDIHIKENLIIDIFMPSNTDDDVRTIFSLEIEMSNVQQNILENMRRYILSLL